jgi:hypothetical protein
MAAWSLDPGAAPALLAIAAAALAFGLAYCAARRRCAPVP